MSLLKYVLKCKPSREEVHVDPLLIVKGDRIETVLRMRPETPRPRVTAGVAR